MQKFAHFVSKLYGAIRDLFQVGFTRNPESFSKNARKAAFMQHKYMRIPHPSTGQALWQVCNDACVPRVNSKGIDSTALL